MKNHQMQKITGNPGHLPVLDVAMAWLRHQRRNAPVHADVWHLRHHWERISPVLQQQLQSGTYQLTPMQVVGLDRNAMWSAQDALVLKWVALQVTPLLPVHARCEHVKGHGGGRASIARLSTALQSGEYRYVCRTDIKGYYGAITKKTVMAQVRRYVADPVLLGLIDQYVHYTVEQGGEFYTPERGICRGCPLSPLIGAMHLYEVDAHFAREQETRGIVYARYMDDFIILAKSRWQLRRQVKALNGYLQAYGFIQHPDKTFIGRLEKGFDWMGAWLGTEGVEGIAPRALANHREKVRRLYERLRMWPRARAHARVSQYRSRWKIWAMGAILLALSAPASAKGGATWTVPSSLSATKCVPLLVLTGTPETLARMYGTPQSGTVPWPVTGYIDAPTGIGVNPSVPWAGSNSSSLTRTLTDVTPPSDGSNTSAAWVPSVSVCGTTTYGLRSADGHAVLYARVDGATRVYNPTNPYSYSDNTALYSAAASQSNGFDGSVTASVSHSGGQCFFHNDAGMRMTWPFSLGAGRLYSGGQGDYRCLFLPPDNEGRSVTPAPVRIYLLWDGTVPAGGVGAYALPAGLFRAGTDFAGWSTSPPASVHLTPPPPACALLVNGSTAAPASVSLGELSPTCGTKGCPPQTITPVNATTTISIQCSTPGTAADTETVTPFVDVVGSVDSTRSNWLLKTSMGDAVTISGTTTGDIVGCGLKGWIGGTDTTFGAVPYAQGKVWVPFPKDGASYGANSPWGSTAGGWNGQSWQSKTATIQWGVCVDPSVGGLLAGPFTASATFTLRVP